MALPQHLLHEITSQCSYDYKAIEQSKARHIKFYISDAHRRQILADTSPQSLLLYESYLNLRSKQAHTEISDEDSAAIFGWTVRSCRRYRTLLTKAGWLFATHAQDSSGRRVHTTYYLGKEVVATKKASLQQAAAQRPAPARGRVEKQPTPEEDIL